MKLSGHLYLIVNIAVAALIVLLQDTNFVGLLPPDWSTATGMVLNIALVVRNIIKYLPGLTKPPAEEAKP